MHWRAFKPRQGETTCSFTIQNDELRTDEGIERYRERKVTTEGIRPGICMLSFHELTERVKPPLVPRFDCDDQDPFYGESHYCTDAPDRDQQEVMAFFASKHVVALPERAQPPQSG